jgi:glycosyltransferase involved in cell wall biosynthesis
MELASIGCSVVVIGSRGLALDRPGIALVPLGGPPSSLSNAVTEITCIATPRSVVYVGRLAPGMEAQHLSALCRLPPMQHGWIRCPTTQDARTLRRVFSRLQSWSPSFPWSVHVLNLRSARYLRPLRQRGLKAVLIENTRPGQEPTHGAVTDVDRIPVFHFSGRAAHSKNVLALLRAWSGVAGESLSPASYANLRLHTLPGPLFATVASLAATIESVEVCGPYPRDTPPFMFGQFLIIPSFREGHPNVLVEAMSRGAIVIGTRIPGVEEHVSASGGILIDRPFSSANIERALLLAMRFSAQQRRELSYRSLAYSRRWCHSLSSAAQAVSSSWDQPREEHGKGSARR